jgi:hypothetical protein
MLSEDEEEFVELVLEICDRALNQNTFEFMIEEGVPAESLADLTGDYDLDEVVESLAEKSLAYTESQKETIRYTDLEPGDVEPVNWNSTQFRTVDRRYIHFTEKLRFLYEGRGESPDVAGFHSFRDCLML